MAVTSSAYRRNQIFLSSSGSFFRREVMTVYITLNEFLLLGTFVLNLIRLLRDIYKKK